MKKYIIFLVIIFIIFFLIFNYKKNLNGNNKIKKSNTEIIEKILNENINYETTANVIVYSNKNQNEYEIKEEETEEHSYLEVISEGETKGLTLEIKENKLILKNPKLNLEKNLENFSSNYLFLRTAIKEYLESENKNIRENNEEIIVEFEIKNYNKYIKFKELYIDKNTGNLTKMEIKDSSHKNKVCIIYNNFKIFQ